MSAKDVLNRCTEIVKFVSTQDVEIPLNVWQHCAGVAIIDVSEVGFVFSSSQGAGVVIKHNQEDHTWGAPSFVQFVGSSAGAVFGKGTKKIMLFPRTEYGLKQLTANTKYQLGAQVGLVAGKLGREGNVGFDAGGHGANVSWYYVFSEGVLMDIGITHNFIETLQSVNEEFYGKENVTANEIVFDGTVNLPAGTAVKELQQALANACKLHKTAPSGEKE